MLLPAFLITQLLSNDVTGGLVRLEMEIGGALAEIGPQRWYLGLELQAKTLELNKSRFEYLNLDVIVLLK